MPVDHPNALPADRIASLQARQGRLKEALAAQSLDALIVNAEIDIRYLTGFIGHDSLLIVFANGESAIISDPRYDEFLDPWKDAGLGDVYMGVRHRLTDTVRGLFASRGVASAGIQSEHLTVSASNTMAGALPDVSLIVTTGLVGNLRMIKDATEVALIEQAVSLQQTALAAALDRLELGMTERQFCAVLEYEMKTRGAEGASFDAIIGTGANSSIIHHMPGETPIDKGVLLIDWGAQVDGYCSDMTRTFFIGQPPEGTLREIYDIVLEAQQAACEACAPGKTCAEIDAIARDIITKAGYGEQFGHGLGHGLGMEVHESPYFNHLETETILQPGMVMTVEPGIYLPGVGGVRIEDDVLITPEGGRVLCDWPRDLNSNCVEPASTTSIAV